MNIRIVYLCISFLLLGFLKASGSHGIGGEMTYKYLGKVYSGSVLCNKYEVSLSIYEDCLNGQPSAIMADNPAFFAMYDSSGTLINVDTSVTYVSSVLVPVHSFGSCLIDSASVCLLKKTFVKNYILPPSPKGYVVAYQRCCRNASIVNVFDPGDNGATYFCKIPPTGITDSNNSAIFTNDPPQVVCIYQPIVIDHSATDVDGDSLSYDFSNSYIGATSFNIKPIPSPPPYVSISYISPFSATVPIAGYPEIVIDPVTGIITGTPSLLGRYLVTIACNEWRNGVLINTIRREFQLIVANNFNLVKNYNTIVDKLSVYPNPTNTEIDIYYTIDTNSNVSINIYDYLGNKIKELVKNEMQIPGSHGYYFTPYISGVYMVEIVIDGKIYNNKVVKI